ncbi:MAG: metallophosphoesterase family protein [bacterium]|nr:metallophosphoesterase family protein [bacterium]
MKTIVVGDIHGCYDNFRGLLGISGLKKEEDRLVLLGDLMDRGSKCWEVLQFVMELKEEMGERCVILRGNHDQMLIDILGSSDQEHLHSPEKAREIWMRNGSQSTLASFEEYGEDVYRYIPWMEKNMVLYYEDELFQCAHAGLIYEKLASNEMHTLLWEREAFRSGLYDGKLTIVGHTPVDTPVYVNTKGKQPYHPVWGMKQLPQNGIINIDTGSVYGGKLTAMRISGECFRFYQYDTRVKRS